MGVVRYTCTACGLITRVEEGQDHISCACGAPYDVRREDDAPADPAPGGE